MAAAVMEKVIGALTNLRQKHKTTMDEIAADEHTRFRTLIKKVKREGGTISTEPDAAISARVHKADREYAASHRALVDRALPDLREEHQGLLRAVDVAWPQLLEALGALDRFERAALSVGARLRTLDADGARDADARYHQWRLRAWPPVRPAAREDD